VRAAAKAAAQAAAHEGYLKASPETIHAIDIVATTALSAAVATAKRALHVAGSTSVGRSRPRIVMCGDGATRKRRQYLMIDETMELIERKETGAYRTKGDTKKLFPYLSTIRLSRTRGASAKRYSRGHGRVRDLHDGYRALQFRTLIATSGCGTAFVRVWGKSLCH